MKWLLAQYIQLEIYFGHEWTAKNKDLKMLRSNGKMHIAVNTEHVDNEVIWCFWCSHWKYSTKKKEVGHAVADYTRSTGCDSGQD